MVRLLLFLLSLRTQQLAFYFVFPPLARDGEEKKDGERRARRESVCLLCLHEEEGAHDEYSERN